MDYCIKVTAAWEWRKVSKSGGHLWRGKRLSNI